MASRRKAPPCPGITPVLLALGACALEPAAERLEGGDASPGPAEQPAPLDQILGGWLGKSIGGALGMPVEGMDWQAIERAEPRIGIESHPTYFTDRTVAFTPAELHGTAIPGDSEWHEVTHSFSLSLADARDWEIDLGADLLEEPLFVVPAFGLLPRSPDLEVASIELSVRGSPVALERDDWSVKRGAWDGDRLLLRGAEGGGVRLQDDSARALPAIDGSSVVVTLSIVARSFAPSSIVFRLMLVSDGILEGFGADDDTTWQIAALHAMELHGTDVTSAQIAAEWGEHVSDERSCGGVTLDRIQEGVLPPDTAAGDAGIGPQIRADVFGLVAPGRPHLAAELERRDAIITDYDGGPGVDAGMLQAALVAGAFTETDPVTLYQKALEVVPPEGLVARCVRDVLDWKEQGKDWREARELLLERWYRPETMNFMGALPNVGIVAIGLVYSEGDFATAITRAVLGGLDTDCNAANVGAVMGVMIGADDLPAEWKGPVGDRLFTYVEGLRTLSLDEVAERTAALASPLPHP